MIIDHEFIGLLVRYRHRASGVDHMSASMAIHGFSIGAGKYAGKRKEISFQ